MLAMKRQCQNSTDLEIYVDQFMGKRAKLITKTGHIFSSLLCSPLKTESIQLKELPNL